MGKCLAFFKALHWLSDVKKKKRLIKELSQLTLLVLHLVVGVNLIQTSNESFSHSFVCCIMALIDLSRCKRYDNSSFGCRFDL